MKFNKLIPELSVSDFEKSLRFYTELIGFKIEYQRAESKFAMLSFQGSQIMIEETNGNWQTAQLEKPFGRGINFQIEVSEIQPIVKKLREKEYPIFVEPMENQYRQENKILRVKEFLVTDPDGFLLRFSQSL